MTIQKLSLVLTLTTGLLGAEQHATTQTTALKPAPIAATAPTSVPTLIPYSSTAVSENGKPLTGETAITLLIFKEQNGGAPLFTESQTVAFDSAGHYAVNLGGSLPNGVPADLFSSGEARWLEVQIAGEAPQPRVLLASVPYALKAADAATLGGLPASAFALAGSQNSLAPGYALPAGVVSNANSNVTTPGGTSGYLPVFTGASTVADSILYASSTGIGVGDVPNSTAVFDVNGKSIWRGLFNVVRSGNATASTGYASFPMVIQASVYNTSGKAMYLPLFQLQAEPTGNNTASTGATFNFLYNGNNGTAAETGLYFNSNGTIHFAAGQTFPGTGAGTITGVTAGTDLTGGGTSGNVTLKLDTTKIPTLAGSNTYTGSNLFVPSIYEDTDVNIDTNNANSGNISPGLRLGNASGEGMASKRTSGGNQYGVDLYTGYSPRLSINAAGQVAIGTGATFNAAQLQVQGASGDGGDFAGGLQSNGNGSFGVEGTGASSASGNEIGGAGGGFYGGSSNTYLGGNGVEGTGGASPDYAGDGVVGNGGTSTGEYPGYGGVFVGGYAPNNIGGDGIDAVAGAGDPNFNKTNGLAGNFAGDVSVSGTLSADEKDFKIDHPSDPANKYLVHSSVESSEMMNIYTGNATTDELGLATVVLPSWFEQLNADFRYQLTVIGGRFAQAVVSKEIAGNQFTISTNASGVKVSWQVTAVRQDPYAKAHPLVVEQNKSADERGFYKHPELYGQPEEKQIAWGTHPETMRRLKAMREAQKNRAKAVGSSLKAPTLASNLSHGPNPAAR